MSKITEDEVLAQLAAIEAGAVALANETGSWQSVYCGNMTFRASSGWTFVVFNDCNEWDYFDTICSPDGRELVFDDIWPSGGEPKMGRLLNYDPESHPVARVAWGLDA